MGEFNINELVLEEIIVVNAAINNSSKMQSLKGSKKLDISFSVTPGINFEIKKIKVNFECTIEPEGIPEISGKFEIAFFFYIENINELVSVDKDNALVMNNILLESISNVVYSTSRGIIFSRCLGTALNSVILPIKSISEITELFSV